MRVPRAESSTARRFSLKGDAALQNNALLNFLGHGPEAGSWGLCAGAPCRKFNSPKQRAVALFGTAQAGGTGGLGPGPCGPNRRARL